MEAFSHPDSEQLHQLDLMILYLKDQTDPEETEHIENLLESDPMYRLAMESVLDSLLSDPLGSRADLQRAEAELPDLLERVREQFGQQKLDSKVDFTTLGELFRNLPGWQKWLGGLFILVSSAFIWLALWQQAPATNLVQLQPDQEVSTAAAFLDLCGSNRPGIGRGREVSLYGAMVEQFAQGKYAAAAKQLQQVQQQASLSGDCAAWTHYYLAQSLIGAGQYEAALAPLQSLYSETSDSPALRHAAHWYLAQLALQNQDPAEAQVHLQALSEASPDVSQHLPSLLKQQYLDQSKQILLQLP
jgi:tetratricopeptide (TPR) repeat protein